MALYDPKLNTHTAKRLVMHESRLLKFVWAEAM